MAMEPIGQALATMLSGMNSKNASSTGSSCPYCGQPLARITTVCLHRRDIPFGPYVCNCDEWRAEHEAKRKAQREVEEAERRRMRIEELFRSSGLPSRWRQRTFEAFNVTDANREAYEQAKGYVTNFDPNNGNGLLLTGTVGMGKTHLAAAVTMELIAREHWVVFGTITSLLNDIRNTFDDAAKETQADVLRRLKRCTLLVIDDLGKEKVTGWVEEVVFEVINARYDDNKALVITTNMALRDVRKRYENVGEAMVDRIVEMCSGVRLVGDSWRRRGI